MSLYKDLKRDYDRVHGTEKVGDLEEGTQEGLESAQDEVRSMGTGNRSIISNWEMDGNLWRSRRGMEDSGPAGHAAQPEVEMPEWSAHVPETSASSEEQLPRNLKDMLNHLCETLSPEKEDKSPAKDQASTSPVATPPGSGEMRLQEMQDGDQLERRLQAADNVYCRRCACKRTETQVNCAQCGTPYVETLSPEKEGGSEHKVSVEEFFHMNVVSPLTFDPESGAAEPLALNAAWKDESDPEWTRLRTVMDSGAAESVGPPSMAPGVPIHESPGSRKGQAYIAAGGERIPNIGQRILSVVTNEGHEAQALYQMAEVTRPLTAVGSTCDRGNVVVYGPYGGCIINRESGLQTNFERRGGTYELDLWVQKPSGEGYQRDFPRLGR